MRRPSSFSASKYSVVTSNRHNEMSPAVAACAKQAVAVAPLLRPRQGASQRLLTRGPLPQVGQDPADVQDRGRLHDPRDDQVPEHTTSSTAASNPKLAYMRARTSNNNRENVPTTRAASVYGRSATAARSPSRPGSTGGATRCAFRGVGSTLRSSTA